MLILNLPAIPNAAIGCSCVVVSPWRCDTEWARGEVIFLGTVAPRPDTEMPSGNGVLTLSDSEVQFSAVEMLRGAHARGETLAVRNGIGGCGYPFITGRRYLVYANDRLTTGACTQTAPAEMVSATVRELLKLRDEGRSDDLFGNVGIAPAGARLQDLLDIRSLPKIGVHAERPGSLRFSTTTDEHGGYTFTSLPRGEFTITGDLPAELHKDASPIVDLQYARGHAGCRVDFLSKPDGKISGRVTDLAGIGVAGFITVEPFEPGKALEARQRGGLPGEHTRDGRFSLELLFPGKYRLIFHPEDGNRIDLRRTALWPDDGSALELALGQHVENVKFAISATVLGR